MEERRASNGHSSGQSGPAQPGDIYKQLINNDMVKELDDIEAISQQISQHAEVLYNSWKSNGVSSSPQFKLSAGQSAPAGEHRNIGGTLQHRHNGIGAGGDRAYNTVPRGFRADPEPGGGWPVQPVQPGQEDRSPHHRLSSESSSVSSPTSSTRESPARGSSVTLLNDSAAPLELLASPGLNGNLEDLVSSFVSTDRAKQAARNTISSTLMRRLGPDSGRPSSPASPASPTSPTSPLSYRAASPLRSPLLAKQAPAPHSPHSPDSGSSGSPRPALLPGHAPSSPTHSPNNMNRSPSAFSLSSDVHAPMQSIFSRAGGPAKTSPLSVQTGRDTVDQRPLPVSRTDPEPRPQQQQQPSTNGEAAIPIQVKHIPIGISRDPGPAPRLSLNTSPGPAQSLSGLKSPGVLASAAKSPPAFPASQPVLPGQAGQAGMPNLFDQFGAVRDQEANIHNMRRRFEEAKQRMALSLPAREGGVRPNSFASLGHRSLFDREPGSLSPWGEDPSAFLLEQFRRRNKRRMEVPSAPHPELTPEQRQHISDRGSGQQRRLLPGGSVAERVLMFEKSPSAWLGGLEGGQVRLPQRKEPQLTGTAITPWRSSTQELSRQQVPAKKERIVPICKVEPSPVAPVAPPPALGPAPAPSCEDRLLHPAPVVTPAPLVAATFPRPRPAPPSSTFRPPSLHLPGKEEIPKFYFPTGNPTGKPGAEAVCKKFSEAFSKQKNNCVNNEELGQVLKTCGLPLFWKCPVFQAAGGEKAETITVSQLSKAWRRLVQGCHDESAQFVSLLTGGARTHLVPEDMVPLIQDVVDTHPGLLFLKEATEFHSRYVHTVIARIFYEVNRSWSGKITVSELRRSKFLATLRLLQDEDDINQVTDFFSYEHFYVIYCKFWELDKDHDLFIDREDLARHDDHALSTRMIERIFCGAVTRGSAQKDGRMSYTEFVWFLLSEEDKRHPTAIEYWFRCMDLDGDGVLSMYELEYFYEEQLQRMEQLGIETLPFDDCLCQMLDMIRPAVTHKITLKDLKRCKMTPVFFDTFFNLEKYLDHEQRDPFATQRETDEEGNELSDWDRFAAEEYELLVAEEGNTEPVEEMCYEDGGRSFSGEADSLDSEMLSHSQPG